MMLSSSALVAITASVGLTYLTQLIIYRIWFHPLAKYPGPRLAALTEIWYAKAWTGGRYPYVVQKAHQKYGPIVRIAPNELSFNKPQAFKDVYGAPSKSRKLFPKSDLFYEFGPDANLVFERDPVKHAKSHKLFAPAFRPQALREQEHIISEHLDIFIDQLVRLSASANQSVNMTLWFEWLTFDIIGQLTFGESFNAVRGAKSHEWVAMLLVFLYELTLFNLRKRLTIVGLALRCAPYLSQNAADAAKSSEQHKALTLGKVRKRVEMGDSEDYMIDDFFVGILKNGDLTEAELAAEANILLTAGAETTATTLAAIFHYLSVNRQCLERLQKEVRTSFKDGQEITGDSTAKLPYLTAVIEETLRMFPPAPVGPPRISPGETVDGEYVPKGTYVSVDLYSMHRNSKNANSPEIFEPERFLADGVWGKPYTAAFSIGPRSCLGINLAWVEMRVILARLVLEFDWHLQGDSDWVDQCRLQLLWKKPALPVRFTRAVRV